MQIADILDARAVRVLSSVTSKKRLFQEIGTIVTDVYGFDAEETAQALRLREDLGSTGVGRGIALPHARLGGDVGVRSVFIRLETPLRFDAVDAQAVDLIFGLFAPLEAGVEHLKSLALVSRMLRDGGLCEKLRANKDVNVLYSLLLEQYTHQAA